MQYLEDIHDFSLLLKSAKKGDVESMRQIAHEYDYGVPYDREEALKWYLKAAKKGDVESMRRVAHEYNYGVPYDHKEALKWYLKAADQGDLESMCFMGECYYNGWLGVRRNFRKAFKWYQSAAFQGHEKSIFRTACMISNGEGTTQNFEKASNWFQLAAEQGHKKAMYYLGRYYEVSNNIEQNYKIAIEWYIKSGDDWNLLNAIIAYMNCPSYTEEEKASMMLDPRISEDIELDENLSKRKQEVLNSYIKGIKFVLEEREVTSYLIDEICNCYIALQK